MIFAETYATPRDVPLHPGAERWYEEHAAEPLLTRRTPD
jgi:TRAP-type uncharacterized transport system substrate-binding protein